MTKQSCKERERQRDRDRDRETERERQRDRDRETDRERRRGEYYGSKPSILCNDFINEWLPLLLTRPALIATGHKECSGVRSRGRVSSKGAH
jgi:hypothetical protein